MRGAVDTATGATDSGGDDAGDADSDPVAICDKELRRAGDPDPDCDKRFFFPPFFATVGDETGDAAALLSAGDDATGDAAGSWPPVFLRAIGDAVDDDDDEPGDEGSTAVAAADDLRSAGAGDAATVATRSSMARHTSVAFCRTRASCAAGVF